MTTKLQARHFSAATSQDVAALFALEASHYPDDGYPAPLFYQALHQWPDLLQVVRLGTTAEATIDGYCMGAPGQTHGEVWLMSLLIGPQCRGMGLGHQLLQHWLHCVDAMGFAQVRLSVAPTNSAAIKLYESSGFVIERLEEDYLGAGEDRFVMCRKALT